MPFQDRVVNCRSAAKLAGWWQRLSSQPEHQAVSGNFDADDLLHHNDAHAAEHLEVFGTRLPPQPSLEDAKRQALQAINGSPGEKPCLVCAGPPATFIGPLTTIMPAASFTTPENRYLEPATLSRYSRLPREFAHDMALLGAGTFDEILCERAVFRNTLRRLFWASEERVVDFPRASVADLRRFLGIGGDLDATAVIRLRLAGQPIPGIFVPTGYDAFDNPHFIPEPYTRGTPVPSHGWTQDLTQPMPDPQHSAPCRGAEEVVTQELGKRNVTFVEVIR